MKTSLALVAVIIALSLTASAFAAAGGGAPPARDDFNARLAVVKEARLSEAFAEVVVKTERPMPWPVFANHRYAYFKGAGKVKAGALGRDRDAAIWLAILDGEYRTTAPLIFVKGGKVPGVPRDRWIGLKSFEQDIMPGVVTSPGLLADKKTEKEVNVLVERATALHNLSWQNLLLIVGAEGSGWRPLDARDAALKSVWELDAAYAKRDAAAMHRAAVNVAQALVGQAGYPPRAKIKLEVYLEKFAILKIGFFLYIVSSLAFFAWAALGRKRVADVAAWIAFAGFIFMTVGFAGRSIVAGYWPTTGMYEYLVLFSWAAVLFFLVFYWRTRQALLGAIVMPIAFILLVLASLFPSDIEGQLIPALQSWWLTIHVTLACLGEGAFAVAFAAAVSRLFRGDKPGRILPSREVLSVLEYRAVTFGYPLFTIGALVAGAIWAQKAWSVWWSWDPKETASLVVFLLATAYLHARHVRGWSGNKAAVLAILIFVASVLTLFANMIFGGLHSYGASPGV